MYIWVDQEDGSLKRQTLTRDDMKAHLDHIEVLEPRCDLCGGTDFGEGQQVSDGYVCESCLRRLKLL
jgi:hypothetical protein